MNNKVDIMSNFNNKKKKLTIVGITLFILIIFLLILSVNLGRADIKIVEVVKIIYGKITFNEKILSDISKAKIAIVWNIRLPRILIAILIGWGLAVSGTVFQSLLMNPLADPYTIGVSTGAAFGAVIAIYINIFILKNPVPIIPFAFLGAILTLLLVMKIAKRNGYMSSSNLIIAGIIVSSILSAGISFLKSASGEQVSVIIFWLMGSLDSRTWNQVALSFPIITILTLICIYFSDDLNILALGEKQARALGVNTKKIRNIFLISAAMITAICVSVSGIIGFIGLIVPHMLRFSLTSDNKALIPLSALLGSLLLLFADNISRVLFNVEIPVGVITTLFGGPFFIYIFMSKNKSIQ
ncbi:FecCD family ABC transporter permease [Tepidibacter formicigenes]|uniref:Iron complex transport system permease protein n=1 Tax=Tepidibacter formicigenes DSM 15518 TaxID=1123349 RepID=A0A1M6S748_9FIRM|nr:iron ABC transporter permease [Tepidibacter formicigenes]SHK40525.1 iron complex transport system permease protein [Tepidibacter formicigenes DSM 15518]